MNDHGFFQITQKAFIRNGNYLLVLRDKKSKQGDLPGGRMNQEEFFKDWLDSLKREIQEELGNDFQIQIDSNIILVHKHLVTLGNHPCIILGYHAKYVSGELKISEEHDYWEWVNVYSFQPEKLFSEYMLDAVKLYLNRFQKYDSL